MSSKRTASRQPAEKAPTPSQRLSVASVSSSGRRSTGSTDSTSVTVSNRRSGIPRATTSTSQARLNVLASSRPSPTTYTAKSRPSPVTASSGITTTSIHISPVDVMAPSLSHPILTENRQSFSRIRRLPSIDTDQDSVLGVAFPPKPKFSETTSLPPRLIPELQALAMSSSRPYAAMSTASTMSSPSTQFTTSPSPWSASTTMTTPTSWSSASPSIVQPVKQTTTSKRSQTVPIPAVSRTRMPKLPVLEESLSGSNSSSKANLRTEAVTPPRKLRKKTPGNSPIPTPPPRSSSIKRTRSRSSSKSEDRPLPAPLDNPPPPLPHEQSASLSASKTRVPDQSLQSPDINLRHNKLQHALNYTTTSSNTAGTNSSQVEKPRGPSSRSRPSEEQTKRLLDAAPIDLTLTASSHDCPENHGIAVRPQSTSPQRTARGRLAKFSRIALFGKFNKEHIVEPVPQSQSQKLQRKGPAAGTGHEGYGKYVRRGRKVSTDGNTTATDSEGSVASTNRRPIRTSSRRESSSTARRDRNSQSDLDDFTATRLKPVVIVGGSRKSLEPRPDSFGHVLSMASAYQQNLDNISSARDSNVQSEVRSESPEPLIRESQILSMVPVSGDTDKPTLAQRRSRKFDKSDNFRVPEPIRTSETSNQPYPRSHNTSQSSVVPTSAAWTETSNDAYHIDPNLLEKQRKKSRKLKWNIFKKKEEAPAVVEAQQESRRETPEMAVSVAPVPVHRSVPYYAMLESESDVNTTDSISDYLSSIAQAVPWDFEQEQPSLDTGNSDSQAHNQAQTPVNSYTAQTRDESPQADAAVQASVDGAPSATNHVHEPGRQQRQPRLAQVGRIPKVVTTRAANPARPSRVHHSAAEATTGVIQTMSGRRLAGPLMQPALQVHTDVLPSRPFKSPDSGKPFSAPARTMTEQQFRKEQAWTYNDPKYPDRQSTTSSSSDGVISVMGPPLIPAPDFLPRSTARQTMSEEDVWNEYDDFIDHMMTPPRSKDPKPKNNLKHGLPGDRFRRIPPSAPPKTAAPSLPALAKGLSIQRPPPLIFATPSEDEEHLSAQEFQLRRSRIISALHSSMDPSSPFSIGDYLTEHGDFIRNSRRFSGRLSASTAGHGTLASPTSQAFAEKPSGPTQHAHYENASHIDDMERSKNPIKHAERSYASLMVARWLSFGRVLFSPAHNEIEKQPERHILVIDGLGSEDWSIYCAVTYQAEQAYVYDLKETGGESTHIPLGKSDAAPPNFRRREIASFNDPFKFPDNYFAAIVLRFPPVMAESKLKNIISECRRVLSPGGYMELMLLDLDIVNMGVVTRRAMRDLKTKIALADREVSLKPLIDNVQGVLGDKGFSKLSRCVVGVPVVGKLPGSESPTSSRSSAGSDGKMKTSSAGPRPFSGLNQYHQANFSLNDLVADHSENADGKIGRMVSRTAQSWWQHCFEAAIITDGNLSQSIFKNKQVLSECKARASSFKLLIAYTQKPQKSMFETRRRTMSEPVVATLATAGVR